MCFPRGKCRSKLKLSFNSDGFYERKRWENFAEGCGTARGLSGRAAGDPAGPGVTRLGASVTVLGAAVSEAPAAAVRRASHSTVLRVRRILPKLFIFLRNFSSPLLFLTNVSNTSSLL